MKKLKKDFILTNIGRGSHMPIEYNAKYNYFSYGGIIIDLQDFFTKLEKRDNLIKTGILNIPIENFDLSVRAKNIARKLNINTLEDLRNKNTTDFLSLDNCGRKTLNIFIGLWIQSGQSMDGIYFC